jgi:hypothetical protein
VRARTQQSSQLPPAPPRLLSGIGPLPRAAAGLCRRVRAASASAPPLDARRGPSPARKHAPRCRRADGPRLRTKRQTRVATFNSASFTESCASSISPLASVNSWLSSSFCAPKALQACASHARAYPPHWMRPTAVARSPERMPHAATHPVYR